MTKVLVVGGYGAFGALVSERLARHADLEIVVAGRRADMARAAVARLASKTAARLDAAEIDATKPNLDALRRLKPSVIVNATGPFQTQDYTLARATIAIGAHCIDLADARGYVAGIPALDAEAKAAGVLVVSGASTVPAVSSAVIDHLLPRFQRLDAIGYGIAPGNAYDPGLATTASILSWAGKPFDTLVDGRMQPVLGWQDVHRHRFPTIGARWLANCDIPDLALFPARYLSLRTQRFYAGTEVAVMHLGLWALSGLVRAGLVTRLERLAPMLLRAKRLLAFLGTDTGGMFLEARGVGLDGKTLELTWHIEAKNGHGPYIPATPSVLLAAKLARGEIAQRGASPAVGLLTYDEIMAELSDLAVTASVT